MSWSVASVGRRWELCRAGCQSKIAYTHRQSAMNVAALESVRYGTEHLVYICGDHYHITTYRAPGKFNYVKENTR